MYYARGLKDLISTTELSIELLLELDEFSVHFINMCFKQLLDDQMGLLTELEEYNFSLFEEFKSNYFTGISRSELSDKIKKAS